MTLSEQIENLRSISTRLEESLNALDELDDTFRGVSDFAKAGDDNLRVQLQEEQQEKVKNYIEVRTVNLENQRPQEQSGTFRTDGSKTVIQQGSYLETISGLFKQTGELLKKANIPESVYDSQTPTYPKAIIHTSPYGCGLGNGAIDEVKGTADAVVAIGGLVTDLVLDEQKRDELVNKFSNLSFDDVKNFAKKSATKIFNNVTDTSDKGWHGKGKATAEIAAMIIPFTGGFKAMDKFGDAIKTFDDLAAKASRSFIGPRQSLRKKFENLSTARKSELVDEDALDGFVTKLSDDAVGDVAKKQELIEALNLEDVSAEEFSIFGKLANDNPKLLTKEYFEEVRGILKHPDGESLVDSWKTLEKAGVDKTIRNNADELTKVKSFKTKNPSKNTDDIVADIKKEGGFDGWKNSLKGFQEIQWKNGQAIWKKKKLGDHYKKHVKNQGEFGEIKINEYHDLMKEFLEETGEFTQARLGNQLLRFDPATKRVIIGHAKNKEILSFYKALPKYTKIDPWTDAVNEAIEKTGLTIKDLKIL